MKKFMLPLLKKSIFAALIGICSYAQAEQVMLTATYTGFADLNTGIFNPARTRQLRAFVDDSNRDGTFSVNEVKSFYFGDLWITSNELATGQCGSGNGKNWCLSSFSYTGGTALAFEATAGWRDYDVSLQDYATSGESAYTWVNYSDGGGGYSYGIKWTPDTKVSVTVGPVPVPEPSTYAMFGLGLGALVVFARRRGNQSE